jgi:SAM-dependent methyltransferase
MLECNICGFTGFAPAPNERLSRKKTPPRCMKCGSLERQRIGREFAMAIRLRDAYKSFSLLSVGPDTTIPKGWFGSSKTTEATESGIDLVGSGREKFDFIVCSHVIQNVRDPRRAVQRLNKSLSADGVMLLNYPSPITRKTTEEIRGGRRNGGPKYIFGKDFEKEYEAIAPATYVVAAEGSDPVTEDRDLMYFLTKSPAWATRIVKALDGARLVQ